CNMVSTAHEVEQTMPLLTTVARHTPQDFATAITHSVVSQFAGIYQAGLIKTAARTDPLLLPVLRDIIQALQADYNSATQVPAVPAPSRAAPGPSGMTAPDPFPPLAPSKGKGKAPPPQDVNMEGAASVAAPAPTSQHSLVKGKPACDPTPPKPSLGEYAPPPVASIHPLLPPIKHMTCPGGLSPL